jgi:hypothetical protein
VVDTTRARRLVAALVVIHIVLHALAIWVVGWSASHSRTGLSYPFFVLGPSQGALLALWLVLGGGRMMWRVLPTVLGVVAYLWFFGNLDFEWIGCTIGELIVCAAILFVARLTGLEMVRPSDPRPAPRPFQFYLRDMFVWTTALAVFLSAWKCFPAHDSGAPRWLMLGFVVTALTLVSGTTMFSGLGRGWIVARIFSLPLAIGIGTALIVWNEPGNGAGVAWYLAMLLGFMALWLVASLLVLRLAGYRLAWRPELIQQGSPDNSTPLSPDPNPHR